MRGKHDVLCWQKEHGDMLWGKCESCFDFDRQFHHTYMFILKLNK